jgi:hypothetical protein
MFKSNEGPPNKSALQEFIDLCQEMGWHHWYLTLDPTNP